MIRRIVVTGPESTGKSTLCRQLAEHYRSAWVPEYARTYLEGKGAAYGLDDLWHIARGQMDAEQHVIASLQNYGYPLPVFIDTDLHVIRIWSEFVFNHCDNRILTQLADSSRDLYLLCNTDLPWTEDPLREHPDPETRRRIFHHYQDAMINQPVPWALISGQEEERLQAAIRAVDQILHAPAR